MTKILLVEDDKSLREIYGTRLLAESYDIVSAGDGEEALAMAIKEKPDLIISDVMMPKISGFDMLDILRSTTETRDIKVIMMTALSSDDQRARGSQLGADKYLVKSQVGIEDVVRAVHEILGDSGAVSADTAPVTDTPATGDGTTAPVPEPVTEPVASTSDVSTPTTEPSTSSTADDSSATDPTAVAVSGAAPGNDLAGPLPPQPTENTPIESVPTESTLPEPTAPFSSPRPSNLGENVIHPETEASVTVPEAESSIETTVPDAGAPAAEPSITTTPEALPDPVATDNSSFDTPTSSIADPAVSTPTPVEPVATGGLGFDTPTTPVVEQTADTTQTPPTDSSQNQSDDDNTTPPAATTGSVSTSL